MANVDFKRSAEKYPLVIGPLGNQRGAALVLALLVSAAVLAVSAGVMEMSNRSTEISGAGKIYNTVNEAADGSISAVQDTIHYRINGGDFPTVMDGADVLPLIDDDLDNDGIGCFDTALIETRNVCNMALTLPSSLEGNFSAAVSLEKLYSQIKEGGRLEFPPSTGGAGNNLVTYYRISTTAVGPKNVRAEKTVLYRLGE